jgi:hypothetical protein
MGQKADPAALELAKEGGVGEEAVDTEQGHVTHS